MHFSFIQLGKIGDMILITPVFRTIKESFPNSKLTVIASRHNSIIPQRNPFVDEVIVWEKNLFKLIRFFFKIRRIKIDTHIDPKSHYSSESNIIARIINANKKVGFVKDNAKNSVFNQNVIEFYKNENLHFTQLALLSLKSIGIEKDISKFRPELYTSKLSEDKIANYLSQNRINVNEYIFVNISAGNPERVWQAEKWIELLNSANFKNLPILISSTKSDSLKAEQIQHLVKNTFIAETSNIEDVISYISKSKAVLTVDTSVVHIASAFNKPLFAIYINLPDFYSKFHPSSNYFEVVKSELGIENVYNISTKDALICLNKLLTNL